MSKTNEQTVDTYNKTVEKYIVTSPQVVDGDLKRWLDDNLAKLKTDAKILKIGSGSGKDADYFASKGYSVECTDASQSFVEYLQKKGRPARLLNALTDDLGSNYDMVFADAVLLHFTREEVKNVLQKIYQALKPGGLLLFSLKAGEGEEITERKLDSTRFFCFWQQDAIEEFLQAVGYADIETRIIDDYRGETRPDWLLISAVKGSK
jgi:2-polyprenyl-3-methyl-5-hydroxy-6-metoxy-1,4-benzoquinol methylase